MLNPDHALYVLKPVLLALVLPPTPGLLLILLGGLVLRKRAIGRWILGAGFLFCWFSCTEWFANVLQPLLLNPPPALTAAQMKDLAGRSDTAVLVLGGGSLAHVPERALGPDLSEFSIERLRHGIWLARRLNAPLGFTGGISVLGEPGRLPEAQLAQQIATQEFGFPLRWAEGGSRTTLENAHLSVPLLKADGVKRVVLVTHAMHLPRVLRAFRAEAPADLELIPAGIDYRAYTAWNWADSLPSGPGYRRNRYIWIEFYAWLAGR